MKLTQKKHSPIQALLFILALCLSLTSFANGNLPESAPYPGGIAVVPLTIQSKTVPKVYFNQQRVLVKHADHRWVAIVGLPLNLKSGRHQLVLQDETRQQTLIPFDVQKKTYPLRHITIKDKSKVSPPKALAKKIAREQTDMNQLLSEWRDASQVPTTFILPVKGRFSSGFGIRRIYNEVLKGRHTGFDIAAAAGSPIKAAASARVLAVEDYVITGNTVILDHGQGLMTYYCHMQKTAVKPGEWVKQGQTLGTVGSTGRSTGAHLHWTAVLNGALINPMLFVKHQKEHQQTLSSTRDN